jgi:glucose-1-phosphate adenylyltransferase
VDEELRVVEFVEKPDEPPSNLVNMGVYLFNTKLLDGVLWEDSKSFDSAHDFGKDILPRLVAEGMRVYSYPFENYWVDVGTVESYWQAHMDLLKTPPPIDLNDRSWIVHTRTEERPPVWIANGAVVLNSLVTDGCRLDNGALVEQSVLSPGVKVKEGAVVRNSVILTDAIIERNALVEKSIIEKQVVVGLGTHIGSLTDQLQESITMVGKNTIVPPGATVEAGAIIGSDVTAQDYPSLTVRSKDFIQTKRLPYEF